MKITYLLMAFSMLLSVTGNALAAEKKDIVDTAVAAGNFKTLAAALQAAGLVETLKGPGPFTVFAPTDEAFAKLPAGTVEELLKPENKEKLSRNPHLSRRSRQGHGQRRDEADFGQDGQRQERQHHRPQRSRHGGQRKGCAGRYRVLERSHSRDRFRNSAAIGWW